MEKEPVLKRPSAARRAQIERDFTYHPPQGDQGSRYEQLRAAGKDLALRIVALSPASPEQDQALMLLNLAIMSANAAIARHE